MNAFDPKLKPQPALLAVGGVVLVVTATEELAKRIESQLRNAGHPLRVSWSTGLEDLAEQLHAETIEVLLLDTELRGSAREPVPARIRELSPDLPVLLIAPRWTPEDSLTALIAGAQDFAAYADEAPGLRHLEQVVIRECLRHQQLRQLRQAEAALADSEARHTKLCDAMSDAVGLVQEGILASANPAFARLLGFEDSRSLAGQPLIDLVEPADQSRVKDRLRAAQKGRQLAEPLPLRLLGRAGPVSAIAQLIPGSQDGERTIELLILGEPATAPAVQELSLMPPAVEAALHAAKPAAVAAPKPASASGRSEFAQALGEPSLSSDQRLLRLALILRIDDFEGLESRIGIIDAQEVGAQIVWTVQQLLGPQDRLFQYSPDEIALIVFRPEQEAPEQFGDLLRKAVKSRVYTAQAHEAQASLSLAAFPFGASDNADTVIRQLVGEARRLSAKGGDQMTRFGGTQRSNVADREDARRAVQVKRALDEGRLKLAYQSIASLEGETRGHYDILLRMIDEQGQEQRATQFLPAATKFNLMRSIDRWVVGAALAVVARRKQNQEPTTLFVKLSEDSLRDADAFLAWLRNATQSRPLVSDELVFEFQERALENHIGKARTLTQGLIELGAGIAIEHYGVGSNSIQLLDHVRAGFLKFHASFMQSFGERDTQKRLQELVEAAKERRIHTIVSHVEDANVMARLWQMGVNFIQGYHIKEPEVVLLAGEPPSRG